MGSLTLANYLGMLQDDPDDQSVLDGLRQRLENGGSKDEDPVRLLEMARMAHEQRGELRAAAWLIEIEAPLISADPDLEAALFKELGRIRQEELLDDAGAKGAFERALALRPGDIEIEDAIEQVDQTAENWKQIAQRFVEEANDASDSTLKTSHLTRAASLIWQYKQRGRDKEVDKLFKAALEADPASTRTARLYAETLRARDQHEALAEILVESADHARNRDEKLHLYVRAARVFTRRLEDKARAGQCYERVLRFSPGHEEALRFLVEFFTEGEQWDKLVALYEDALRSRQKLESEQGTLLQIGMVHWRIRNASADAEPYFGRLRKIDPAHPGMLSFYREYFQGSEDPARFLTILGDAQRVTKDPSQKLDLAVELAKAAQGSDATVERAVDAWKAVQRQSPSHPEARGALRELYAKAEKWNALVELLKSEIDSLGQDEAERKVALLREMVPIYRDKLELDVMVINTYNAVLSHVPDDSVALQELSRTYEGMGRWNDLIQVLTRQADAAPDADQKVTLFTRIADLWIDQFANYNHAVGPLESVVALDPENRRALGRLKEIYEKKRAWSSLFEVLKKEAELASDPEVRFQNKIELAKLAGERLHKNADAIALWREIVAEAPDTEGAIDALERLAEREKDWPTLAEVLERRLSADDIDDAPRIRILTKLGTVYGEHIDDPSQAAGAWQRVLALDPKNGRATRTLRESFLKAGDWEGVETLYSETEDWEGLVEVLGSAAEKATDEAVKVGLSFRAAEIYEQNIGEPQRAFRNYERVLSVDATNVRAATALLPIYERDEKWRRVVAMKEVLLGALAEDAPLEERLALFGELGRLSAEELSDEAAAFAWAKRAYALAPEDAALRATLENSAAHNGSFEELSTIYQQRLEVAGEGEALTLRRRLATLAGEELGNTAAAITQLEQILAADPADQESVEALDRLYRAENRTGDLCNLYQHRIDHAEDNESRVGSLRELAALEEDVLDQPDAAVAHLERLLALEPADSEALSALDRLHTAADRPKELADILRRRRELDTDDATRIELVLRFAELLRGPLEDPRGAVDAYSDTLRLAPGHDQAVAGLEALAEESPDLSLEIGRLLEAAYESKSSYQKLADVLERRLTAAEDPAEVRDLRLRLAELAGTQLGDVEGAYDAIEAAFLSQPTDQGLWERIAEAAERAGKYEELAGAYAMVLDEEELQGSDLLEIAGRTARIHDELLGDPAAAEPFHRMVLAEDSLDERAFEALKQVFTDGEKWDDLQVLYRSRIANTVDLDQKRELLLQVCFLFEELLDDAELAIRAYQDVLELDPDDVASRRALDRLFRRTERWADLAALLKQDLDGAEGQDELDLTFELGQLHEEKLDDPDAAVNYYERVLEENPTHLRSQEALERLISNTTQRQRIAGVLEPLYEAQGAYPELARILEVQLEDLSESGSQVGLLLRIAELAEVKNHNMDRALTAISRAVSLEPADPHAREELGRIATIQGAEAARARVLEDAANGAEETYLVSELLMELARLYDEHLGDLANAEKAYTRLIEVDSDNPDVVLPASEALERIHLGEQKFGLLAQDLRRQVPLVDDPADKRGLLVRLADLLEDTLEDTPGAIAAHQERLENDSGDVDAMLALERLYERGEEWQKLIGVLQTRDNATDDDAEQQVIARRVGEIYEEKLADADNAIVAYNEALSRFGTSREILGALGRLYQKTEKWDDLLEVVEQELADVEDPIERAGLRFRAGELMRQRTGDLERAIEAYSEVMAIVPDHEGALEALEAIVAGDDSAARIASARVLTPRFEGTADYEKLIAVLIVTGESDDPQERLASLRRAAEVADIGLESPSRAFELTGEAIKAALGDPGLAQLLADLERHSVAAERFTDHVAFLRNIVTDVFDGDLSLEILLKIADAAVSRLEDDELAAEYYDKVLEESPEHREALDSLEALKLRQNDHRGLLAVLQRKTELAEDPAARIALLLRQAELSETSLEDVDAAIDAYEQVLNDEVRPAAFDGLERLYRRSERFEDLASVLERRLDAILGGAEGRAADVRYRLGRVCQLQLEDTHRAIDCYREVLSEDVGHADTVAALEGLMDDKDHQAMAAELLEPVFLQQMDWPKVTATLEARVAGEDIPEDKKVLLGRLGQIHEDYLEDLEGALEVYARLFKADPVDESSWDTLTRLARNLDKYDRLAEVYGEALAETGIDEPVTAKLATITGRLHEEKTGDLSLAAQFYRSALEFDPADLLVFQALAGVYRRLEDWSALVALHRARLDVAESDGERCELLHVMAEVTEGQKADPDAAVDLYREVLEFHREDSQAINELDRLLTRGERWADLAEHVRHRIDIALGTDDEVPLKHRLGELLVDRLEDRSGALDVFEEITEADPTFSPTVAKLEQMVTSIDGRLRITQLLEPIYRGADEWRKLIAIYEAQVELGDDLSERVRLLGDVGRLHEERGRDGELAFDAWSRAFVLDPHDEATRGELDRLAMLLEAWDQQVAAYEAAVGATDEPALITELLTFVADTHDERRGDPRSAIETYERILVHDTEVVEPLSKLEQLHTMVGDWRGLVDVLGRRVERVYDPEERGELLRREASVLEELLGDRDAAIEAYEKATVENDSDEIALEGLDRLYSAAGNSPKLGEILARRLAVETDPELRVEVAMRLGGLLETQLSRPEDAIDAFNRVLDDDAQHTAAILSLARLYERQAMWSELLENIRLRAGLAEDTASRVELTHRAGEVLERELDDVHEALAMYEETLGLDGRHAPTFDALLRIANLADYLERAADILEPRLEIQERWDDLASLLTLRVDADSDPLGRRDRFRRIAHIHEQGRGDLDAAFEALSQALAEDPADEESANELERVGVMLNAHDRVADAFSARASAVLDPMAASRLFTRLARLAEENLGDDQRAIQAYARASEQVGDDDALLESLDRLYTKTEAFSELSRVLERRVGLSNDPAERNGLLVRLGAVKEQSLGDVRGAFNAYQEVLESEPSDLIALQAMEGLANDESLAAEVVETLDSVYRQTGAIEKVAELYDIRIRLADSDGERARLLIEAAAIYETELGRGERALDAIRRAFELDPRDQSLLDDVERLAGATSAWESLRGLVEEVTKSGDVENLIVKDLNLRAATWYRQHLGDAEAAEARLRAAIAADPESGDGYERLTELLETSGREADLVAALSDWAAVELDESFKRERLSRAATMAESALGDVKKAMECYEAILAFEPGDLPTLGELTRLVAGEERWDDVVALVARRIDAEADPMTRLALRHELASVHLEKREARDEAIDAYRGVLDEDPTDLTAIDALEGLYETEERWEDLAELLERRLDVAQNQAEQITARVRLARLSEQRFGRREQAMDQLRAILEIDPQNGDALDELERLLGLDSKWDELVDLLEGRANDAATAQQSEVEVDILVRLAAVQEDQLGNDAEALATNQRVLEKSPQHEGALRALVALHEKAGEWNAVATDLSQLIGVTTGPEAIAVAYRLADVAISKLEDVPRAEGALRTAYDLDPASEESRSKLKSHYEAQGQWTELAGILADEEASAADDAAKVTLLKEIAKIYEERLADPGRAAEHLERASQLTPDDRGVLLPLCDLYIAAGRSADAIPVLRQIIESYGRRRVKEVAQFHHRLGKALEGMGDEEGALGAYDAAFKIDLTNVVILRDLGKLCHRRGDLDRAQKTFRALLLQKLDDKAGISKADVYFYLGDVSAKQGDERKAKSMLQRALAENKEHAEAKALLDTL